MLENVKVYLLFITCYVLADSISYICAKKKITKHSFKILF